MKIKFSVRYRKIPGFPGYRAGSDCSIWSCLRVGGRGRGRLSTAWKKLKPTLGKRGYLTVSLRKEDKTHLRCIHTLMLSAFVSLRPPGKECRHLDGNKLNNNLCNLTWGTPAQNDEDRRRHGTLTKGEGCWKAKLNEQDVRTIRRLLTKGHTGAAVARQFGVHPMTISDIRTSRTWKHIT